MIKDLISDGLKVYFDGINYDAENFTITDDIPFYIEMAKKNAKKIKKI